MSTHNLCLQKIKGPGSLYRACSWLVPTKTPLFMVILGLIRDHIYITIIFCAFALKDV